MCHPQTPPCAIKVEGTIELFNREGWEVNNVTWESHGSSANQTNLLRRSYKHTRGNPGWLRVSFWSIRKSSNKPAPIQNTQRRPAEHIHGSPNSHPGEALVWSLFCQEKLAAETPKHFGFVDRFVSLLLGCFPDSVGNESDYRSSQTATVILNTA